jgi:hypothetical protein
VSFFDHWLSEKEAWDKLNNVSAEERIQRDAKHRAFFERLLMETNIVGYRIYGRKRNKMRFRMFRNPEFLRRTLAERATHGEFQFSVVAPSLGMAFFSGYDDTSRIYVRAENETAIVHSIAADVGLHVLE